MRTIKFRIWDKNNKIMLYEFLIAQDDMDICNIPSYYKEYEWLQFTGLKDKNEKEIYEGDIVEYNGAYAEDKKPHNLLVEYHNKQGVGHWNSASFVLKEKIKNKDVGRLGDFLCMPDITLEVIGNIYEDYKLLNKEEK